MRAKFIMQIGMKEHPETGVLLYPGDIFEVETDAIMKPPEFGGWLQRDKDPAVADPTKPTNWVLVCAKRVPDDTEEGLVMRDEPSQLIGLNISEKDFLSNERARDQRSAITYPEVEMAKASAGVESVRRRQAPPKR